MNAPCILPRYGLTLSDRAALMADAWTGSFSKAAGMDLRRLGDELKQSTPAN